MRAEPRDLQDALDELRLNFHRALANRFGREVPNERELRKLIAREREGRRGTQVKERTGTTATFRLLIRWAAMLVICVISGLLLTVGAFKVLGPPLSPAVVAEKISGKSLPRNWVPLAKIAPDLPLAVIASEDNGFCTNWGVDWREMWHAINGRGKVRGGIRGASTITMQLVKNLYLWPERSYLRKALEVPLAHVLTALWPKNVLMETYLNIAPLGPGVVGAEAASKKFFHKSAADLTRREAILLAIALPSPGLRNPAKPTPRMLRKLVRIERGMNILKSRATCVLP